MDDERKIKPLGEIEAFESEGFKPSRCFDLEDSLGDLRAEAFRLYLEKRKHEEEEQVWGVVKVMSGLNDHLERTGTLDGYERPSDARYHGEPREVDVEKFRGVIGSLELFCKMTRMAMPPPPPPPPK